jgi:hypothetical protein
MGNDSLPQSLTPGPESAAEEPSLPTGRYKRHIFLCADQSQPKCAPREATNESWGYLKRRLAELGLATADGCVYRSKVKQGPDRGRVSGRNLVSLGDAGGG